MIHRSAPDAATLERFLARARSGPFSHAGVGATLESRSPAGYKVDRAGVELGRNADAFPAARTALERWRMFDLGWVRVFPERAPVAVGSTVVVVIRAFGLHWLNAARIVYVIDEPGRFGFAYGTLHSHQERGEERFLVVQREDGGVDYELLAFSRPARPLGWLGYPLLRRLQARFRRDSCAAMRRAAIL